MGCVPSSHSGLDQYGPKGYYYDLKHTGSLRRLNIYPNLTKAGNIDLKLCLVRAILEIVSILTAN